MFGDIDNVHIMIPYRGKWGLNMRPGFLLFFFSLFSLKIFFFSLLVFLALRRRLCHEDSGDNEYFLFRFCSSSFPNNLDASVFFVA